MPALYLDCQFEDGSYRRSGRSGRFAKARSISGAVKEACAMFARYGATAGQIMLIEGNPYAPDSYHGYVVKRCEAEAPHYEPEMI